MCSEPAAKKRKTEPEVAEAQPATGFRQDLQYRPIQKVGATDAFKNKHTGLDTDQPVHVVQNQMAQRWEPCRGPEPTQNRDANFCKGFTGHKERKPPKPHAEHTQYVTARQGDNSMAKKAPEYVTPNMSRGDVCARLKGANFSPDGIEVTQASGSEWTHMRRQDGGLKRDANGKMKGNLDKDGKINHYAGQEQKNKLMSDIGHQAVGAAIGAAVHIAEHHMHKDDEVKGGAAAVAQIENNYKDGSQTAASFCKAQALSHSGSHGRGAAAGAKLLGAKAKLGDGIPGTGGIGAPVAEVQAAEAQAGASVNRLGARASANACVGRVSAGLEGTPFMAEAQGPGVGAAAGIHAGHVGASIGAHAGEASAGPFAIRAGFKIGGGWENGSLVVHAGPVSGGVPCSIM